MLRKVGKYVAEALEFAARSDKRATGTRDLVARADHERQASRWRHLAESFDLAERVQQFLLGRRASPADPPDGLVVSPQRGTLGPAAEDRAPAATYRVWQSGNEWFWEVNSATGQKLGYGSAGTCAKARAAAFQFCLARH